MQGNTPDFVKPPNSHRVSSVSIMRQLQLHAPLRFGGLVAHIGGLIGPDQGGVLAKKGDYFCIGKSKSH